MKAWCCIFATFLSRETLYTILKMIKKTIFILLTSIILFLLYVNFAVEGRKDNLMSKLKVFIFDNNSLNVESENNHIINSLKIIDNYDRTLFENGETKNRIQNEYGHTLFNIYLDNEYYAQAGHFKTNWWHTHDYKFIIKKINGRNIIELNIEGPNSTNDNFVKYFEKLENGKTKWTNYDEYGSKTDEWVE